MFLKEMNLEHSAGKEILQAVVDDSGSGGDSPWFVLAGYVGTTEAWDAFPKPWRTVLNEYPRLEYFKGSEVYGSRPDDPWAGASIEQRNARLDSLIKVIGDHALRAIYVRVKQVDYNEVIKPYIPVEWDHAYYFLFIGWLAAATSMEKHFGGGRPVEFFFDNTALNLKNRSKMLYAQVMGLPQFGKRVHKIHYVDEKQFLPLQAADLLAWQVRRRFSVQEPARPQFEDAINCPREPAFTHTMTRAELENLSRAMDENAMFNWALSGRLEHLRPWRRPRD